MKVSPPNETPKSAGSAGFFPAAGPGREAEDDIKDLAQGALVNFVGKLGRLARVAFVWSVAILFGKEVLGLYSLAWNIISPLVRVARFGLRRGVVRFVVEGHTSQDKAQVERSLAAALILALVAGVITTAIGMLAAETLAAMYGKPIAGPLQVLAWSMPFSALACVFISAIRALRIMRAEVYAVSIFGPLVQLAGGGVAWLTGAGLEGLAWAQVVALVGIALLACRFFRRYFSLRGCLRRLKEKLPIGPLSRFCLPVMLTDLIYALLIRMDVLMLGWLAEEGLIGIYVIVQQMASSMLKIPQAFDAIFSSVASELAFREEPVQLAHRFAVISRWILTFNLPLLVGLLLLGDVLLPHLLENDETQALVELGFRLLLILGLGMMLQGLFAMIEPLFIMSGRPYLNLMHNGIWLSANFVLNIVLIQRFGVLGAAWAAVLSTGLIITIRLVQWKRIYASLPFHRSQLKPLAAALGGALCAWGVRWLVDGPVVGSVMAVATFLAGYIGLLVALGFEAEDRALFVRIKGRLSR